MQWTTSDLLDDYRHADLSKRLHLYLQYPELRPEFTEMDRIELPPATLGSTPGCKRLPRSRNRVFLWLIPGFVKRHYRQTLPFLRRKRSQLGQGEPLVLPVKHRTLRGDAASRVCTR